MKINPALNIGHLKLELFTNGIRIDPSCNILNKARPILRTRGGLGSGLELILPGKIYVNIPVEEKFVKKSHYILKRINHLYFIYKNAKRICRVTLPKRPKFYDQKTSTGKLMSRIGIMQGTYLAIYPTNVCEFWKMFPRENCKFCSVGLNLGRNEDIEKSVQDVLEVTEAAREEEGITFVHFNSGFNYGKEIQDIIPYVRAVKEKTGLLVGVQIPPLKNFKDYYLLKKLGVDHISICMEFFNSRVFTEICPGKNKFIGQKRFLKAIEYASNVFGKGRVAGEIIAGLEPVKDSLEAIEEFAKYGAVSTVCVFRPCTGTDLETIAPPRSEDITPVFAKMYEVCMKYNIPIDIAPNIKVSLVILPYEGKFFVERNLKQIFFSIRMILLKIIYYLYFVTRISFKRLTNAIK